MLGSRAPAPGPFARWIVPNQSFASLQFVANQMLACSFVANHNGLSQHLDDCRRDGLHGVVANANTFSACRLRRAVMLDGNYNRVLLVLLLLRSHNSLLNW